MNILSYFKNGSWKGTLQGVGMKLAAARPEILLVTGGISLLVGTIHACTKTEEAKKVHQDTKEQLKKVEEGLQLKIPEGVEVSPETLKQVKMERGKQYLGIYIHAIYEYMKLYGVSSLLWFGGMGMIVGGHTDLRIKNRHLIADVFAGNQLMQEYRGRVAKAVGEDVEKKIYLGAQEGMVNVIETDETTGKEKIVQKSADIFYAQPGSVFARNFTPETTDILYRSFTDELIDKRVDMINRDLDIGLVRAYSGLDILRKLGYNETAMGEDENIDVLLSNGISGNARKVPDPEMRRLKITKLRGYQKKYDVARGIEVYEPCLRIDFNFYPLEGKI